MHKRHYQKPTTSSTYDSKYSGFVNKIYEPKPAPVRRIPSYQDYEPEENPKGSDGMIELLAEIYKEHGIAEKEEKQVSINQFPVYQPKQSSEYHSILYSKPFSEPVSDSDGDETELKVSFNFMKLI